MMSQETIEKRREKEFSITQDMALSLPVETYQIVIGRALKALTDLELRAFRLRFMDGYPIALVADLMSLSWEGADALIDRSLRKFQSAILRIKHLMGLDRK